MGNKKKGKKESTVSKKETDQPFTDNFPSLEEASNTELRSENEELSAKPKSDATSKPRKYGDIELKVKKKGQRKSPSVEKETEEPKYSKRNIVSNWERYEEGPEQLDQEEEMNNPDYMEVLRSVRFGSHFQFQSESRWKSEDLKKYDLSVDTVLLSKAVSCIPLHERLKLPLKMFSNDLVQELQREAFELSRPYYESAGKDLPEFKEQIQESEPDEPVLIPQEVTIDASETQSNHVSSSHTPEDSNKTEISKVDEKENEVPQPQEARQKRERRPRRAQVKENSPQATEFLDSRDDSQVSTSSQETKSVESPSYPSSSIIEEPQVKQNVVEENKCTPEKLESLDSADVQSNTETEMKPVASLPPRAKEQLGNPQENLDDLLKLTKPVDRFEEDSDEEEQCKESPKKDVVVVNIQPQANTSASLEDWLDSILDE